MARILSYGAGLVGSFICDELSKGGHEVTAIALNHDDVPMLEKVRNNLSFTLIEQDAISHLADCELSEYDLVLNLLPGRIGDSIREQLISNGVKVCDLAFSDNSPDRFSELAKQSGASMIHDCGIAPGVSNMVVISEQKRLPALKSIKIRVGGNPLTQDSEWSYCAPFSPTDVIEEYTRPARIRVDGEEREVPAITDRHTFIAGNHGEMEAFLTDGLRSLLTNPEITCESLSEYTVRWPGHIEKFLDLRTNGELDEQSLVQEWTYTTNRSEFTYMDITFTQNKGPVVRWEFDIPGINESLDRLWPSMAIATGIPFLVACEALLGGRIEGIQSPDNYYSDLDDIIIRLRKLGAEITRTELK
jgi:saccharopine dehydrogenase-like NADP-dependent oxidoreductase